MCFGEISQISASSFVLLSPKSQDEYQMGYFFATRQLNRCCNWGSGLGSNMYLYLIAFRKRLNYIEIRVYFYLYLIENGYLYLYF